MDLSRKEQVLYDFRKEIVGEVWSRDWENSNILEIALRYELSIYKDVEADKNVKKKAFIHYCEDYEEEYRTADIMNGWWYCFKELMGISSRRDEKYTEALTSLLKEAEGLQETREECPIVNLLIDKGNEKYTSRENSYKIYKSLILFLKVVYTIGNMTPAPINPSQGRGLDNWEYKLKKYEKMYHNYKGDIEKLCFQDYCIGDVINSNPTTRDFKNNPEEYMQSRIKLILNRGYRIVEKKEMDDSVFDEYYNILCQGKL